MGKNNTTMAQVAQVERAAEQVKPLFGNEITQAAFKAVIKADNRVMKEGNPNRYLMRQGRVFNPLYMAAHTSASGKITACIGSIRAELGKETFNADYAALLTNPALSMQKLAQVQISKSGNVLIKPLPAAFGIKAN